VFDRLVLITLFIYGVRLQWYQLSVFGLEILTLGTLTLRQVVSYIEGVLKNYYIQEWTGFKKTLWQV